jgi:hypothetical protein
MVMAAVVISCNSLDLVLMVQPSILSNTWVVYFSIRTLNISETFNFQTSNYVEPLKQHSQRKCYHWPVSCISTNTLHVQLLPRVQLLVLVSNRTSVWDRKMCTNFDSWFVKQYILFFVSLFLYWRATIVSSQLLPIFSAQFNFLLCTVYWNTQRAWCDWK